MMKFERELLWQYAEDYVQDRFNAETIYNLLQFIENEELLTEWNECIKTIQTLDNISKHQNLKSKIQGIQAQHQASNISTSKKILRLIPHNYLKWGRNIAVILAIVITSSLLTTKFSNLDNNNEQQNEFISLKRDILNIKHSQEQLKQTIDDKHSQDNQLIIDNQNIAGTGFAITNDGYLVTDYHVIDKADSVYIKMNDIEYKKAYLVAFDVKSDIAILKIEDKKFKFSKTDIPYHLLSTPSPIAQSIFSIGYPQDNVFYTEGYISSHSGVNGSKVQYQLELPAHPGQSGSPIFDNNGEIIGMLLGKKTYATYAVKSSSIIELIKSLPKEHKIKLTHKNTLKGLHRTEQVKRANEYVFPVLVFKS